jgi:hypothetical protein
MMTLSNVLSPTMEKIIHIFSYIFRLSDIYKINYQGLAPSLAAKIAGIASLRRFTHGTASYVKGVIQTGQSLAQAPTLLSRITGQPKPQPPRRRRSG